MSEKALSPDWFNYFLDKSVCLHENWINWPACKYEIQNKLKLVSGGK